MQHAKTEQTNAQTNGTNGTNGSPPAPVFTPSMVTRLEAKWRQVRASKEAWQKVHAESLEAKAALEAHREELER